MLPEKLWQEAVDKAHQGAHPGMASLKRRIRSHFWFPCSNDLITATIKRCPTCQVFTDKTTKEPISTQKVPAGPWEDVHIDLFGPLPDKRHVLVALDNYSRFPAAKMVPSTGAKPVLKALNTIYTDYGYPERHRTDNGPPFNSKEFADYSTRHGIVHDLSYPYHPQGNPAETFMKPLGKAIKSALHNKQSSEAAVEQLLASYRATPHSATKISPGNVLLRNGYRNEFPRVAATTQAVTQAEEEDRRQRRERRERVNASSRRQAMQVQEGDLVLMRNSTRTSKFQPRFHPDPYRVVDIDGKGVRLERTSDAAKARRHKDDVKLFYHDQRSTTVQPTRTPSIWVWDDPVADSDDDTVPYRGDPVVFDDGGNAAYLADDEGGDRPIRPQRTRRPPPRLDDYVAEPIRH